mmetsp:Transcript_25651/g.60714  ORF Transcript_25651/g.60714 Transcript_25651/m.60714 type:complete len:841 (-) Transcript_25651:174-2696(-)
MTTSSTPTYGATATTTTVASAARSSSGNENDNNGNTTNDNGNDNVDVETGVSFPPVVDLFDLNTQGLTANGNNWMGIGTETGTPDDAGVDPENVVELATLILPKEAAEDGLEVGDGAKVVLEAEQSTVDNIIDSSAPDARVTAVVDLEVLGALVGENDMEALIADLRHDEEDDGVDQNDEASNAGTSYHSGARRRGDSIEDERQSLVSISSRSTKSPVAVYDRVTLEADPFIETLAESLAETEHDERASLVAPTLPTIFESKSDMDLAAQEFAETTAAAAAAATTTASENDRDANIVQDAAATKMDDDNHFAHDAFLLNIPTESADGDVKDHFVLALPEIRADSDESVASTISQHSQEEQFPILQRAWTFLSEDLHLPSDIVSIQLEAHLDVAPVDDAGTVTGTVAGTIAGSLKAEPSVVASSIGGDTFTVRQAAELNLEVVVKREVPVVGYLILISGLVALSSVGAALDLQTGPSALMKTLWRFIATSSVLSPLVVKSFYTDGLPDLTRRQLLMLPCAAAAYTYMVAAFVVALEMTTLANAFVLSNMTSLVIIFGRSVLGLPVLKMEGAGAVIGFTGAAVCAQAAIPPPSESDIGVLETTSTTDDATEAMIGNVIAFSASFGTAIYLIFAKSLRTSMDIFVFMFSIMSIGALCTILYMLASGEVISWDMHPDHGLFGWLRWELDRLPLELFMAIVCNCIGTTGYIAVMKYFEPIVPASAMLMEPVVGSLLGVLARTSAMPGLQTWIGDAIVAGGTFLVIYSGAKKTEKIDATEALRPSAGGGDDASAVVSLLKSVKSGQSRPRKPSDDLGGTGGGVGGSASTTSESAFASGNTKVVWEG